MPLCNQTAVLVAKLFVIPERYSILVGTRSLFDYQISDKRRVINPNTRKLPLQNESQHHFHRIAKSEGHPIFHYSSFIIEL